MQVSAFAPVFPSVAAASPIAFGLVLGNDINAARAADDFKAVLPLGVVRKHLVRPQAQYVL